MDFQHIELTGERAKLVPMSAEHGEGMFQASRDERIWAHLTQKIATRDEMHALVAEALSARERGTEYPFVIFDQETNTLVGSSRFLNISTKNRSLEIGWTWYNPSVWRTRLNTECKYLLLRHCFETLQTNRVEFKTDSRNIRSQQAIERLGAVKEGVFRHHMIVQDGYLRDSVYYSIIKPEWPAVKARLEQFLAR